MSCLCGAASLTRAGYDSLRSRSAVIPASRLANRTADPFCRLSVGRGPPIDVGGAVSGLAGWVCIGIRSVAVVSGKLRRRRSSRVLFKGRPASVGQIGRPV